MAIADRYTFHYRLTLGDRSSDGFVGTAEAKEDRSSPMLLGESPRVFLLQDRFRLEEGDPEPAPQPLFGAIKRFLGMATTPEPRDITVRPKLLATLESGDVVELWRHGNGNAGCCAFRGNSLMWGVGSQTPILGYAGIEGRDTSQGLEISDGTTSHLLRRKQRRKLLNGYEIELVRHNHPNNIPGTSSSVVVMHERLEAGSLLRR